ncbi:hypothetical protein MRI28_28305 [Nocardiopsis dassonvillei]|uniref:hypothetical protein n=1 Tax=Nocardiopsis dassonvillei TaxID=2014 RepID=UPI00200DD00F|nr:hypothetical protein [Nocardiopsis dassonvillei]MCK9873479.1 hypothetical protein [Nocardiopsis dassonvillei]
MADQAVASAHGRHTCERTTVRVDRHLAAVYRDSYRDFGWTVENGRAHGPHGDTVTLMLRRDRPIKDRATVAELQRRCERALEAIADTQGRQDAPTATTALVVGAVSTAFLASMGLALTTGMALLSVPLGVIALVAPYLVRGWVRSSRLDRRARLVDEQYAVVHEARARAHRLLA